jgi:hypothetical protein
LIIVKTRVGSLTSVRRSANSFCDRTTRSPCRRTSRDGGSTSSGRGEGAHGVLKSHYKLNTRRRYRSKAAVELETNIVFAIMLSLAIQQREHERTDAPPASVPAHVVAPMPLAA